MGFIATNERFLNLLKQGYSINFKIVSRCRDSNCDFAIYDKKSDGLVIGLEKNNRKMNSQFSLCALDSIQVPSFDEYIMDYIEFCMLKMFTEGETRNGN